MSGIASLAAVAGCVASAATVPGARIAVDAGHESGAGAAGAVGAHRADAGVSAAGAPATADVPVAMRLLVKLAQPSTDADAIMREAAAAGGVPVRYLAPAGAGWHALALQCTSVPQCDGALQRLRSDTARYAAVERDGRKRPSVR